MTVRDPSILNYSVPGFQTFSNCFVRTHGKKADFSLVYKDLGNFPKHREQKRMGMKKRQDSVCVPLIRGKKQLASSLRGSNQLQLCPGEALIIIFTTRAPKPPVF